MLATGGVIDLNQLLEGLMVACVCVSVCEAAGRPGGAGPATEQTECVKLDSGGIHMFTYICICICFFTNRLSS